MPFSINHSMTRIFQIGIAGFCLLFFCSSEIQAGNYTTIFPPVIEAVPLEATVTESPARINIKTYLGGTFTIYRKLPTATAWTQVATGQVLAANAAWTDTTPVVGTLYEYKFLNTAGIQGYDPLRDNFYETYPTGYILCGIKVDQTLPRGRIALVVANDVCTTLPTEYTQYKADLVADGWAVHEIQVPRALNYDGIGLNGIGNLTITANGTGYSTDGYLRLTSNSSKTAMVKIKANVTGTITATTVYSSGANFSVGDVLTVNGQLDSLGSTTAGTGASFTVAALNNTSAVSLPVIGAGGTGYTDNDIVTLTGVTSGAIASGSLIAKAGPITTIVTVLPNTFTVGETLTISGATTGSGATATVGAQMPAHIAIRNRMQALNTAYTGELKTVTLLGRVPVCRSGIYDNAGADGHGNRAAYGADAFYADMDGAYGTGGWNDTLDNFAHVDLTTTYYAQYNLVGDSKYDAKKISEVGNGKVELGFGRIDLSSGIKSETEGLRTYFSKLHRYKTANADFLPGRKVCDRLLYRNERNADLMSMPGVVGMDNIEFISSTALPAVSGNQDPDQFYSAINGPYLFYFKGSKAPGDGEGGKMVFTTGMQSHYGYWYDEQGLSSGSNSMQKQLAENSFTLSQTWNIWGLRYLYHRMGMGLDISDMMKESINNQGFSTGPYAYQSSEDNGDFHGSLYMNHIGDPALRLFMFAPPSRLSVVKSGSNPALSWVASPEPTVTGYHVYRKSSSNGAYTRLTTTPQAGTTYSDSTVSAGTYTYMVRAVRLETTGGGTFYNASLGIEQSLDLTNPAAAISITNSALADANWNTAYQETLTASGGIPQFNWTLASGVLPTGITLSTEGVLTGTPTVAGAYAFSIRATDQMGLSATKAFSLSISSNDAQTLLPTDTSFTQKSTPAVAYGAYEYTNISAHATYMYETFQKYDLSGVSLNNGFVKATLQLYVLPTTTANCYALVQANLISDAQDTWSEGGATVAFDEAYTSNGGSPAKVRLTSVNHGLTNNTTVTVAGFSGTANPNGDRVITYVDADHFDLDINYSAAWTVDPALAYVSVSTYTINYNNRPTAYNTNVSTISATGNPVVGSYLEIDVTPFVAETLANDSNKIMSLRLFTETLGTNTQTTVLGSRHAYGAAKPRLVIQTSDAPAITIASPTVNPSYVYLGAGININATATAIPARAGALSVLWTKESGSGTVNFSTTTQASTSATFSAVGDYVLRLTATDGVLESSKDVTVRVVNTPLIGITDNMTLRLSFDEGGGTTAIDASGNSNNGTLVGATWSGSGKLGGAISVGGIVTKSITAYSSNATTKVRITCVGHGLETGAQATIAGFSNAGTNGIKVITKIDADTFDIPVAYVAGWTLTSATATYAQKFVKVNHSATLDNTQKLSLSLWINPTATDASIRNITRKYLASSASTAYGLTIANGKVSSSVNDGTTPRTLAGTRVLTPGQWSHVVLVFDGSLTSNNCKIYINGTPDTFAQIGVSSPLSIPLKNTSPLWIGASNDADILPFSGLIDEYRIYQGKALTQSEIFDLYQASPNNMAPQITLGASTVSGDAGVAMPLSATVTDDGLPAGSSLSYSWTKASGSGGVTFTTPAASSTNATAAAGGTYTFRLTASDGEISTFADVLATVTASSAYQTWLSTNGLPTDGSGDGALSANPSGDGIVNAMKCALGLGVNDIGFAGRMSTELLNVSGSDYMALTCTRPEPAPTGITYVVKVSSDLSTWTDAETVEVSNTVDASLRTIKVRDTVPVGGANPKRFIRLEVTLP